MIIAGVVVACVLPTIVTWLYFVVLANHPLQKFAFGLKAAQFAFPVIWVLLVLRESVGATGLSLVSGPDESTAAESESDPAKARLSVQTSMALSIGMGTLVCIAMWAIYRSIPDNVLAELVVKAQGKVEELGFASAATFIGLGVFYSLVHSFLEEYYFRWFAFGQLRRVTSFWPAALFSGVAFMAHHVIILVVYFGWSPLAAFLSFSIAVGGVLWAWIYEKSRSLLGVWVSHLMVDAGIFYIGFDLLKNAGII